MKSDSFAPPGSLSDPVRGLLAYDSELITPLTLTQPQAGTQEGKGTLRPRMFD